MWKTSRTPQHHIFVSSGVGGQSGKSTSILMLLLYLIEMIETQTIVIIDMVSPKTSNFTCFKNIFNIDIDSNDVSYVEGFPFIKIPRQSTNSPAILVVQINEFNSIATWPDQVNKIIAIQKDLIDKGFAISHIITETNLQPDDPTMSTLMTELTYSALHIWTLWVKRSLFAMEHILDLTDIQDDYRQMDSIIRWHFIHNAYQDTFGRSVNETDGSQQLYTDYPAMKKCFESYDPTLSQFVDNEHFVTLSKRAQEAKDKSGNSFWEYLYKEYSNDSSCRPINLLPLYRRSEDFHQIMTTEFTAIKSINTVEEYPNYMKNISNGIYSEIFAEYFKTIGL